MAVDEQYLSDVEAILSHRHDNGADLWTTPDKRLLKGAPFSILESISYLMELGMDATDPLLQAATELIFSTWREDGRFRLSPEGAIYPCHTVHAAELLCRMGYASDFRMQKSFQYLLDTQYTDGGWRCNKFSFGRGPETEFSNPFPTLTALNAFRFSNYLGNEPALDKAVDFLLEHWIIRKPIGPCHYGMLLAPIILLPGWKQMYAELIEQLADKLDQKVKKNGFIEIILMTYSFVQNAINSEAFPNAVQIFDRELMTGRGRGKYCYRTEARLEAEAFLRQKLEQCLGGMKILYIS